MNNDGLNRDDVRGRYNLLRFGTDAYSLNRRSRRHSHAFDQSILLCQVQLNRLFMSFTTVRFPTSRSQRIDIAQPVPIAVFSITCGSSYCARPVSFLRVTNPSSCSRGSIFPHDHTASRLVIDERRNERTKNQSRQDRLAPVLGVLCDIYLLPSEPNQNLGNDILSAIRPFRKGQFERRIRTKHWPFTRRTPSSASLSQQRSDIRKSFRNRRDRRRICFDISITAQIPTPF